MTSSEDRFWALSSQADEKKITRSRMGQLAKLCHDYDRALSVLQSALKTKNPSNYLGAVVKGLRDEQAPPCVVSSRPQEPEVVLQARLRGWPVRKTMRTNGEPGWYVAGSLFDKRGMDVGA